MEQTWQLETPDGHKIYGVLNGTGRPASAAIFIVHGLTGHMNEYAFKRAADHFSSAYDVYRFNLYDGAEKGRALTDCTIQTHADDLQLVLSHFGKSYQHVFLIGHSYGGPTVMLANPDKVTAVSLWDPSFDLHHIQSEFSSAYQACGEVYCVHWGTTYLIGRAMYEEAGRLDQPACRELARAFRTPVQVIHAGDGFFVKAEESYHTGGDLRNIREVVDGSVHCFYEGNTCDDLLRKTASWFEQFKSNESAGKGAA